MNVKFAYTVNRFFKSVYIISILFLLAKMLTSTVDYISYAVQIEYFLYYFVAAFLVSVCKLVPIKFIRKVLKVLVSLSSVLLLLFMIMGHYISWAFIEHLTSITPVQLLDQKYSLPVIICFIVGVVFINVICKEKTMGLKAPVSEYKGQIYSFKRRTLVLTVLLLIEMAIPLIEDYSYIYKTLVDIFLFYAIYIVAGVLNIRTARDVAYAGIDSIAKPPSKKYYIALISSSAVSFSLLALFKNRLDASFKNFVETTHGTVGRLETYWTNVKDYLSRLMSAYENRYEPPDPFPGSRDRINQLLENAGFDFDKFNNFLPDGGLNDGGIGGVPGGGSGMGSISNFISQSGNISFNLPGAGGNSAAVAIVRTNKNSLLYLKLKSFGDYNTQGWDEPVEYTGTFNYYSGIKYGMNYLSGLSLFGQGYEHAQVEILTLTGQYFLPDYLSPIHSQFFDCPTSDCLPNPYIQQRSYTVNFFSYSGYNIYSAIPNEFKNAEQLYRNHVKNHYLSLPQSTNAQVTDFLNDNGIYAGDKDCIEKVFDLLSEYTYDIYYDQALDNESDVVISFLTEYKEGICQHFASSATVMFRAVGIPARYVGGLYAGNLLANQETVLTANSAHAWVEIYKDGVGWIRLDPTSVAIVENALPSGSYPSSDYKEGNSNEGSGDGDSSGGGSGGGSGGNSGDSSTGGSGDSSTDSSNDSSSNSSTSSNSSNSSSSSSSSSSSNSSSSESSSSTSQPDTSNENCSSKDIPWQTIAIVGSALMVSAIVVALIALLRKTKKKIKVRRKQETQDEILPEEVATLAIDEETRIATEIIRENYKEFIKIAGKNGIRKYPKDTTQSLRNKYSYAIGPNQAMEILTQLYRIARYNKNERLTMDDANQSKLCLDIIKQSFANPESKTEDGDKE